MNILTRLLHCRANEYGEMEKEEREREKELRSSFQVMLILPRSGVV